MCCHLRAHLFEDIQLSWPSAFLCSLLDVFPNHILVSPDCGHWNIPTPAFTLLRRLRMSPSWLVLKVMPKSENRVRAFPDVRNACRTNSTSAIPIGQDNLRSLSFPQIPITGIAKTHTTNTRHGSHFLAKKITAGIMQKTIIIFARASTRVSPLACERKCPKKDQT